MLSIVTTHFSLMLPSYKTLIVHRLRVSARPDQALVALEFCSRLHTESEGTTGLWFIFSLISKLLNRFT